jgi:hypothetical protein
LPSSALDPALAGSSGSYALDFPFHLTPASFGPSPLCMPIVPTNLGYISINPTRLTLLEPFGWNYKLAEKYCWLIFYERKILFRLKKQAK